MLAATVWPTSTLRATTMPSIGAVMIVWPRLTCACSSCAFAWTICASADFTCASAWLAAVPAVSRSDAEMSCCALSSLARRSLACVSRTSTAARSASACSFATVALALFDLRLEERRVQHGNHLPRRTVVLKSADSDLMLPDTCVPTCTVLTGWMVPVASTVSTIDPRETRAVTGAGVESDRATCV
jgi:hypothetical protein